MASDTTRAVPIALPFDDEGDAPVPFALTAAAHRALDPSDVPALRLVPAGPSPTTAPAATTSVPAAIPPSEEEHDDLRPAQARALRRSGMRVATIAAAMGVDAALVTRWTHDLAPRSRPTPAAPAQRAPGSRAGGRGSGPALGPAAALAVALARVDADGAALTLTDDRPGVLAAALGALRAEADVPSRAVRVAARVGSAGAADRLRADLISALGVPAEQVVVGRWQEAPDAGSVEIRVRVAGTRAVRLVDRWAVAITGPEGLVPVAVGG